MIRLQVAWILMACTGSALGQMDVGSDGSDGAFAPVASIQIDLSAADTGPGTGHYDPDRWAVIFNYTSVDIPNGVIVSFANHPSGAPVVWLVGGDANIAGAVSLDGENQTAGAARPAIAGPGGSGAGERFSAHRAWAQAVMAQEGRTTTPRMLPAPAAATARSVAEARRRTATIRLFR